MVGLFSFPEEASLGKQIGRASSDSTHHPASRRAVLPSVVPLASQAIVFYGLLPFQSRSSHGYFSSDGWNSPQITPEDPQIGIAKKKKVGGGGTFLSEPFTFSPAAGGGRLYTIPLFSFRSTTIFFFADLLSDRPPTITDPLRQD